MAASRDRILWKPHSDSDGNLVILFPYSAGQVTIRDADTGEVLATGRSTGASNGFQDTIRFDRPGGAFSNVIVEDGTGRQVQIGNGANRIENINAGQPGGEVIQAPEGAPASDFPGSVIPGTNVVFPGVIDPSLIQFNPVGFNPIRFNPISFTPIDPANFNFTDPIQSAREAGAFNREQSQINFLTGIERGREIQRQELAGIQEFATGISQTQRDLVAQENAFNQVQRLEAADVAIPGVQDTFRRQRERAETLAQGNLLTTAQDRAFELASRSASADGNVVRGFGDDSVAGRRTSEILSAQQRLGVQQIGENFLSRSLQQAAGLLFDTPLKTNISQRLPSQPNIPLGSLVGQQQQIENQLTTISPTTVLQAQINQEQFATNLEQRTNELNQGRQIQVDQFNASSDLGAQQFNSSGQFQADTFNSTGIFNQTTAQFNAMVANQDRINAALQAAQNQILQESQAAANAAAAGAGINAAEAANNAGAAGVSSGFSSGAAAGGAAGAAGALGGVTQAIDAVSTIVDLGGQVIDSIFGTEGEQTPAPITTDDLSSAASASGVDISGFETTTIDSGGGVGIGGQDAGIIIPAGESIPSGFQGVQSNSDGSVVAIPQNLSSSNGDGLGASTIASGAQEFGSFVSSLSTLGVGSSQLGALGGAISVAGGLAQQIISSPSVSAASASGDKVELANQLESEFISAASEDQVSGIRETFDEVRDALQTGRQLTGFSAQTLAFVSNFDRLSDTQKVRGAIGTVLRGTDIANQLGVTDLSSQSISNVKVPGTDGKLNLGATLSLFNAGVNVFSLIDKWDQLSAVDQAIQGTNTGLSIVNTAQQLGLLGSSTPATSAAIAGQLGALGAVEAPAYGLGAISVTADAAAALPASYTAIATDATGAVIAVPAETLASSAVGAGASSSGGFAGVAGASGAQGSSGAAAAGAAEGGAATGASALGVIAGGVAIGAGVYSLYDNWGTGGADGRLNGALAGASIAAGLYTAGVTASSTGVGAIAGVVLIGLGAALGSIKTGKHEDQVKRDALRDNLESLGIVEKINGSHHIELADGNVYNIGLDGSSGQHEWHNPDFVRDDQQDRKDGPLNAYDVDYTSDIAAIMNLSGNALSNMVYGTSSDNQVRQMGGYFTNAAIAQGTADLDVPTFDKAVENMRHFYQTAGINTKQEAYTLANQMFAEGRVSEAEVVAMHQGFNVIFDDDGFAQAQKLMEGVNLGRGGANQTSSKPATEITGQQAITRPANVSLTGDINSIPFSLGPEQNGQVSGVIN